MAESILSTVMYIALGIIGLGIVVFVHELGHFVAARLVGIDVEAFSIGWGKAVLRKTVGGVEYRLGMFPVGGYCKMRGENEINEAMENGKEAVEPVKGTYYGAGPLQRILVCVAGPFFNLLFAFAVLSAVWGMGRDVFTFGNRIVLQSQVTGTASPADEAGFESGDRIVMIDGKPVTYWHEIQQAVAIKPEKPLAVEVERDGKILNLSVIPALDKNTGVGVIGIRPWIDTVIGSVAADSGAAAGGLLPGDRITGIEGQGVENEADVLGVMAESTKLVTVDFERDGSPQTKLIVTRTGESMLGISWQGVQYRTPALSPAQAVATGARETMRTVGILAHGLTMLFRGINLTEAVSGPLRMTYMAGEIAVAGFQHSGIWGMLYSAVNFLALISLALGLMNMLPLPMLDGGQIVLFAVEAVRRRPTHPKVLRTFQTVGVAIIFSIMAFALFGDLRFLGGRIVP